jgi:DNA topoisomerase IB
VRDRGTLDRIAGLAVPPAWHDVWICPWPNGHIQAVGIDDAGRRQYRYHDHWRELRDVDKFDRVLAFGHRLPRLRKRVVADLAGRSLSRDRVLAAAVRLLDVGSFRVGGEEYRDDHETYGLATLLKRHVRIEGATMTFRFPAKSGQRGSVEVCDREVANVLRQLCRRRGGGTELLAFKEGGTWHDVRAEDINAYIKQGLGDGFSAKDFRTWNATVTAVVALASADRPLTSGRARREVEREAVAAVARQLGNTPTVSRSAYVDPRAIEHFHRGETASLPHRRHRDGSVARSTAERATATLLDPGGRRTRAAAPAA